MKLSAERLRELEALALAQRPRPVQLDAAELLELVRGYREQTIDFGEVKAGDGAAFIGALMGGFAGASLERRLAELPKAPSKKPEKLRAKKRRVDRGH